MEHNENDLITALPQEIIALIFSYISSVADLVKFRHVSKVIKTRLNNPRIWRDICVKTFDLEFIDENSNWLDLMSIYGTINCNIRQARVLVHSLVVHRSNSRPRKYIKNSYVKDENRLVVNWWLRDKGGDFIFYHPDHVSILNITTRQEEQRIHCTTLAVIGDRLAEVHEQKNTYVPPSSRVQKQLKSHSILQRALPESEEIKQIVSNDNPNKKHLIVAVTEGSMYVYDLNEDRVLKTFAIDWTPEYHPHKPDVIFHDTVVYVLQCKKSTLCVYHLTRDGDEPVQVQLLLAGTHQRLHGAHKSLVLGSSCTRNSADYCTDGYDPWTFDSNTGQYKALNLDSCRYADTDGDITSMTVLCGVLAISKGKVVYFVDYLSHPMQLQMISCIQCVGPSRPSLQPTTDGKLFVIGEAFGSAVINFEHATDECEVLFVEASGWKQTSTPVAIKAFELVSRAQELLGTDKVISRYFKMNEEHRFGVIYAPRYEAKKKTPRKPTLVQRALSLASRWKKYVGSFIHRPLSLPNMDGLSATDAAYTTPYLCYRMQREHFQNNWPFAIDDTPEPVKEFYGSVILFYEEWTGTRWKLSKPSNWITK